MSGLAGTAMGSWRRFFLPNTANSLPNDPNHCGLIDTVNCVRRMNGCLPGSQTLAGLARRQNLVGCPPALQGHENSPADKERERPPVEPVQRRDRTRGNGVGREDPVDLFRPSTSDRRVVESELVNDLAKPAATALHRLEQHDVRRREHRRDHDTRQTSPGAEVDNTTRLREEGHDRSGVQQVPLPQPADFAGAHESTEDALVSQHAVEALDRVP